jgi:hypothetical protein
MRSRERWKFYRRIEGCYFNVVGSTVGQRTDAQDVLETEMVFIGYNRKWQEGTAWDATSALIWYANVLYTYRRGIVIRGVRGRRDNTRKGYWRGRQANQ